MTVAVTYHLDTVDLAKHSKFFPAPIRVPHHQLRNFISTVYENKIYFVHEFDISVLDLRTNQRTLVATVPFEARCLAAAHGWVCVGGETRGQCAFVQIGPDDADGNNIGLDMVVKTLGKEIVNSMTIHTQLAERPHQRDEVVVLISNNDKTVTLYSLSQETTLAVLEHPVAMNYASMSPDSTIIAAVGDSNVVFFYAREPFNESRPKHEKFPANNWKQIATPKVPCGEEDWDDYSFAVAFSPNGKLCAVSAQGGYITVLDMQKLTAWSKGDRNSIICTFQSSRSGLSGCVRSLSFSPEPWDLMAWTEDHGRAGIADVRRDFSRRQCIMLDRDASSRMEVTDTTPAEYANLDLQDRLKQQSQRMHGPRGLLSSESLDESQTSLLHETHSMDHVMDLDRGEQSVLDALETTIDNEGQQTLRPYSINYNPTPSMQPSATSTGAQGYDVQLLNPAVAAISELSGPERRNSVILSEPNWSRSLMPPDSTRTLMTASPAPLSEDSSTPPMSTNDLTPSMNASSSQPMPYNIPPSDPWHVIEAALGNRRPNQASRHLNTLAQVDFAIAAERRMANRLERQLADERRLDAIFRMEQEAQERSMEARQRSLHSGQIAGARSSPTSDNTLQQQIQTERNSGSQRTNELESELRLHTQRLERLTSARSQVEAISGPSGLSARPALAALAADIHMLEPTLRHLEEDRRSRRQRIHDLETQLRRAQSRIDLVFVNNSSERSQQRERQHERSQDAQFLHSARVATGSSGIPWQLRNEAMSEATNSSSMPPLHTQSQSTSNRLRASAARRDEIGSGNQSTRLRNTELAGRVSESDIQLARIMLSRHSMDGNGNWIAANGYRRLFGPGGQSPALPSFIARETTETRSIEEVMRDRGLGTAGVGWSPDGKFVYFGTEAGIFELKMNTKDRLCFPSTDFR